MKKLIPIVLVLILTMSMFAGCRSRQEDETGNTGTTGTTASIMPDSGNMIPDANDTVDPSSGANQPATAPSVGTATTPGSTTDITGATEGSNRARQSHIR